MHCPALCNRVYLLRAVIPHLMTYSYTSKFWLTLFYFVLWIQQMSLAPREAALADIQNFVFLKNVSMLQIKSEKLNSRVQFYEHSFNFTDKHAFLFDCFTSKQKKLLVFKRVNSTFQA